MRRSFTRIIAYVVLSIFTLISVYPFILTWFWTLKEKMAIYMDPLGLPHTVTLQNLKDAWIIGRMSKYMVNSIIIAVPTVAIVVFFSSLAAYSLTKIRIRGTSIIFFIFLVGLMIPFQGIMIPLYYDLRDWRLIGTYWAVIIPIAAYAFPFGIFLMRAFLRKLPQDLVDAARLDGCGDFSIFLHIILPLAKPALASLSIFEFLWTWNNFLVPLIYLQDAEKFTLTVGIMFFRGRYTLNYALIAAGVTIASLPILVLFLIFTKQFIKGLTAGAIKG